MKITEREIFRTAQQLRDEENKELQVRPWQRRSRFHVPLWLVVMPVAMLVGFVMGMWANSSMSVQQPLTALVDTVYVQVPGPQLPPDTVYVEVPVSMPTRAIAQQSSSQSQSKPARAIAQQQSGSQTQSKPARAIAQQQSGSQSQSKPALAIAQQQSSSQTQSKPALAIAQQQSGSQSEAQSASPTSAGTLSAKAHVAPSEPVHRGPSIAEDNIQYDLLITS